MEIFIERSEPSTRLKKEQKSATGKEAKKNKERRKADRDRRHCVNDGLLVHLSATNERRSPRERRKVDDHYPKTEKYSSGSSPMKVPFRVFV